MKENEAARNRINAGKSIINRHERTFRRGSLMFIEGESSTEMFIVRSGSVRILKQEGENTVELAQLGPGSVLGELALLDRQPRSATAQVLEDTKVTVIDEELFTRTLKNIPDWLGDLIQLVVKRLRDTMRKKNEDIVRNSVDGVLQIILLLSDPAAGPHASGEPQLTLVKQTVSAVMGIGGVELEQILLHLILKELLFIRKDGAGREHLHLRDRNTLRLYTQYLRIHRRGGTLTGECLSECAFDLVETILEAGRKNGASVSGKLLSLGEQQIEIEWNRRGSGRHIDRDALDQLLDTRLLQAREEKTETGHGHHTFKNYQFNPEVLQNVVILRKWLPVFREEIKF